MVSTYMIVAGLITADVALMVWVARKARKDHE